uniref:Uncharacterized protein n=1 Tax=Magallana gigas TaxID=29159 RepID=K1PRZ0_MAGGI
MTRKNPFLNTVKDEGVDDRLPLFHPNDVLVTKLLIVYRRKVIRKARMFIHDVMKELRH